MSYNQGYTGMVKNGDPRLRDTLSVGCGVNSRNLRSIFFTIPVCHKSSLINWFLLFTSFHDGHLRATASATIAIADHIFEYVVERLTPRRRRAP